MKKPTTLLFIFAASLVIIVTNLPSLSTPSTTLTDSQDNSSATEE